MPAAAPREVNVRATQAGWTGRFVAMGSPCEVLLESVVGRRRAKTVVESVADEAWRIEDKFSRYLPGNIIDRINSAAGDAVDVDDETGRLIDFAGSLYELSEGRFDISSGVLREAWVFDGSDTLPDPGTVERILGRVGWHRVLWERPSLRLAPGMQVDLGGIGKEYAVDRCAEILKQAEAGQGLVNFGGDLAVTGPPTQRKAWKVAVEGRADDTAEQVIELRHGALATSGDARRFLLRDGVRYSHILDPRTGWPVRDAPASVTVAADTCTQAGMLSTLAMLEGPGAEEFLQAQGVLFWCRR